MHINAVSPRFLFLLLPQSVIISGESGAGKTEATKKCIEYLAGVAGGSSGVADKIVAASPLLEAYGNAKTLRNNNSSRFGKWMEIHFDGTAAILGCSNTNYLLEKGRVIWQDQGERNYHIFYQFTNGSPPDVKAKLLLEGRAAESFQYLAGSGCTSIPGMDENAEYAEVAEAMELLGFGEEEQDFLGRIVSSVLHIGDITFDAVNDGEGSKVASDGDVQAALAAAAKLLGCPRGAADLELALIQRTITTGGGGSRRASVIKTGLTVALAVDARDALAKALYGRAFDWLVRRVNSAVRVEAMERAVNTIGILDIFGFEIFESNSFEQVSELGGHGGRKWRREANLRVPHVMLWCG